MRWFDDLAIVVTFRQVDPLYAVDLTDPDRPRLLGELKIPGFSAYLHPLGEHRLLGLGQAADAERHRWGAQAGALRRHRPHPPAASSTRCRTAAGSQALADRGPAPAHLAARRRTVLTVIADYGTAAATSATSRCSASATGS